MQDVLFLKIAFFRDIVKITEYSPLLLTQYFYDLIRRPDVKLAFNTFAVGVFSGIETSLRRGHIPQHISKDALCNISKKCLSCSLICLCICDGKQRLVIKHFFKMRNEPVLIRSIYMESASQLIVNTTTSHPIKGFFNYLQSCGIFTALPPSKEKGIIMGSRKLGRRAKTAVNTVVIRSEE